MISTNIFCLFSPNELFFLSQFVIHFSPINLIHFEYKKKIIHKQNADDLKHVVGSETTRYGLLNCFSMWQHKTLNKRLVLVLFNEILTTLYQCDDLTKHIKWAEFMRITLVQTPTRWIDAMNRLNLLNTVQLKWDSHTKSYQF